MRFAHLKVVHRERDREREEVKHRFFLHFMKRKDIVNGCHTCPCMGIIREEIEKREGKMHIEVKKNLAGDQSSETLLTDYTCLW
jgi:negative regulator of genetic competence, sporulation and motility